MTVFSKWVWQATEIKEFMIMITKKLFLSLGLLLVVSIPSLTAVDMAQSHERIWILNELDEPISIYCEFQYEGDIVFQEYWPQVLAGRDVLCYTLFERGTWESYKAGARIKLIDYIAALSSIGAKIKTIEIEPNFNNIKPDAYIKFVFDKKLFHQLIEIELRHDYVDVNRFKPVLGYILQKTNNVRPTIVIIQDTNKDYNTDNFTGLQVIQLNTKLREIAKVININR